MVRYRSVLDIANVFEVKAGDPASAAHAWTALAIHAMKFPIPWEDKPFEHNDYAFECLHKALNLDPENQAAGMNLAALSYRLGRLNSEEAEFVRRWPRMREWISRLRLGEPPPVPQINHAVTGPVYRPFELSRPPTQEQLSKEPAALRPWICRIDGRHVYLSEDLVPSSLRRRNGFTLDGVQSAARRLMADP